MKNPLKLKRKKIKERTNTENAWDVYPPSGSWVFVESVLWQRGQSQSFLGSDRQWNKGPQSQIAAWVVQVGCGEAHLPSEQGAALGQVPGKAGGGVSILGAFRATAETARERGTSATPHVREGKASFEAEQETVLLKCLRLHAKIAVQECFSLLSLTWLRKQIVVHALGQKQDVCGGVQLANTVKIKHFSSCFFGGVLWGLLWFCWKHWTGPFTRFEVRLQSFISSKVSFLSHCFYDWAKSAVQNRSSYFFWLSWHLPWLNVSVSLTHITIKSFLFGRFPLLEFTFAFDMSMAHGCILIL